MKEKSYYFPHLFFLIFLLLAFSIPVRASTITISQTSATIQSGKSITLKISSDNAPVSGVVWGSSDSSIASVNQNGTVTGKAAGSAVITAMYNGNSVECIVSVVKTTTSETIRYNVLLLDSSGSMKGTPLVRAKTAAKRFAQTVLSADGKNYIAIVTLNSKSQVICNFTNNKAAVNKSINSITSKGSTNMEAAFANANTLMKNIPSGSNIMKNVILCSDGLPACGKKVSSGKYTSKDHKNYKYANAVYKLDSSMKNTNNFIYALGFFHNASGNNLIFGKRLMKDLASKDKYYVIEDTKDIDKVFDNIASQITSMTLSNNSLTLYTGSHHTLTAYINGVPENAIWKSADSSIASVNSKGTITGKKTGTTIITATINSKTASCKVIVKEKPTIKLNKSKATIQLNKTIKLSASVTGDSKTVKWSSDNASIATVNSSGTITGKKTGTAIITASCNGVSATCTITVINDITSKLTLYKNAVRQDNNIIRLTQCATWQSGSVWYSNPINTKNGFTASFQYWAGGGRNYSYGGADGIVLNLSRKTGIGENGGSLGFCGYYGVELDSYYNSNSGIDPVNAKHIAIIKDSVANHLCYRKDDRVDDSQWHTVKVIYKNKTLKVYLDGTLLLTQENITLDSNTYLGISASTGGGINAHYIRKFIIS